MSAKIKKITAYDEIKMNKNLHIFQYNIDVIHFCHCMEGEFH